MTHKTIEGLNLILNFHERFESCSKFDTSSAKKGRLYKSSLKANSKIGKSIIPSTDTDPC